MTTTYYAVCNAGGPISHRIEEESIDEAIAEVQAHGREWIDDAEADAEDDLRIEGEGMDEEAFGRALEAAGCRRLRDLSAIANAHAGTVAHEAGGWWLWEAPADMAEDDETDDRPEVETCDRCHEPIDDEARSKGWPIAMDDGYICPACYGAEAYCTEGHVLPADVDSSRCAACDIGADDETDDTCATCESGDPCADHDDFEIACDGYLFGDGSLGDTELATIIERYDSRLPANILARPVRQGEIAGTYLCRADGSLQILGGTIHEPEALSAITGPAWAWAMEGQPDPIAHCECGEAMGEPCQWTGPTSETVVVEYMPEQHRDAHTAAGNVGSYPHNGAIRIRCSEECAERIIESDGPEWAREVA